MKNKNTQIRTRVEEANFEKMELFCKERKISRDSFINSAINEFFKIKEIEGIDAVLERIGNLETKIRLTKADIEILSELISFYILYWFTYTPPLPKSEIDHLTLQGFERHKEFLAQLQRRLGKDEMFLDLNILTKKRY